MRARQKTLHGADLVVYLDGHTNFFATFVQILLALDQLDDGDRHNKHSPNNMLDHPPMRARQ